MAGRFVLALSVLLLASSSGPLSAATIEPAAPLAYGNGELLVVADDRVPLEIGPGEELRAAPSELTDALVHHGLSHGRVIASGVDAQGAARRFIRLASARPDFDPVAAAAELRATGLFLAVSPNYRLPLSITLPNDYYLPLQWYVYSHLDQDVLLPEAWDYTQGGTSVVIGIMDTGVDTGHEDLWRQIWSNPGEIRGNHLDDDHNGYIDDFRGWDFGDEDNDPNPGPMFDPSGVDVGWHGTFVAAIAAASTDNTVGIAGAGWNCRIMPLKVMNAAGNITLDAVATAFDYAARMNVKVLNISLGAPAEPGLPEYFQALVDMANSAGVLCVAAAGNSGTNEKFYPAACTNVISVGALDQNGARASFSNWGPTVDIAAPGTMMWSAISGNYAFDQYSAYYYQTVCAWDGLNPYMYADGTSFATPLVAGVCGLVRTRFPSLTPELVARRLFETGDVVSYDHPIGRKLDALKAVSAAPTSVAAPPANGFGFAAPSPNPSASGVALRFTLVRGGVVRLGIYDCAGRMVRELAREPFGPGWYARDWDGADQHGQRVASGVYFARLEGPGGSATVRLVRL